MNGYRVLEEALALLPEGVEQVRLRSDTAGYQQELWFGLLGPAGLPRPVLARLNTEIGRILADDDTKGRWAPIGMEPRPTSPEDFDRLIASEIALYTRIARAANITSQ